MEPAIQTVTLSLYRFDSLSARLWAFAMMGLARPALGRVPGLTFWKLCGSGKGFIPKPDTRVCAILCAWSGEDARQRLAETRLFQRYRAHASENWTLYLSPVSSWGAWAGVSPFEIDSSNSPDGPLAALTRATLKPGILLRFWSRVPEIDRVIGADPNVAFSIGIGEIPFLHQVTFSIWPDTRSMAAFARDKTGPHAKAIKAVRDGKWFREELYARFRILGDEGTWNGASPLKALEAA